MTRAAIYARYSDERQRARSIDDQVALCRDFAARQGFTIADVFSDAAISGASVHTRPGFARLVEQAKAGRFAVILAEDMDRLARNQVDTLQLRDRMEFIGVDIYTVADGRMTKLNAGVKGFTSALFLDNLVLHIRRGMAGVVRDGRHAGGRAYGYRPRPDKPGELEIVEEEADVVRDIFARYRDGQSGRMIAKALNAAGVSAPRGPVWSASTMVGNAQRGHGILANELYAGVIVWNRVRMVKNPDTGKRVSRVNPQSEWQRAAAAHLAIVDRTLFDAVQQRRIERTSVRPHLLRRPRRLLSGLLRCGACGGGMSLKDSRSDRQRVICTQSRQSSTCDSTRGFSIDDIERRVIEAFRMRLGSRAAIAHYVKTYNEARQRAARNANRTRAKLETKLAAAERGIDRVVSAIAAGSVTDSDVRRLMAPLRVERDRATAAIAALDEPPVAVAVHPSVAERYVADLEQLADLANADIAAGNHRAASAIRRLLETVTVMPCAPSAEPDLKVQGTLERLLGDVPGAFPGGVIVGSGGPTPAKTPAFMWRLTTTA